MNKRTLMDISDDIHEMRMDLLHHAAEFGLNHDTTIQKSEALDRIIYEYQVYSKAEKEKLPGVLLFGRVNYQLAIS
ncbi:Spo0E family sporulation regulatory protein-aspartic acid phosphatase [Bacillus sp. 1P06AnD]|uniref:Spo0E family sporulation regulatory protein-aspartic acid phosphatase n=1 Tax=Bacillus sp. 1P06AnD TaxID=3132208 RepID=UPI0039A170C6